MLIDQNNVARIDPDTRAKLAEKFGDRFDEILERSARSTECQTKSTIRDTFKQWPKSVLWSLLYSLAIIQIGYDASILPSFFAQPTFTSKFGKCKIEADGSSFCEIPASWQQGLTNGAWVGGMVGLQFSGSLAEKFGHTRFMMLGSIFILGAVFIPFFASSLSAFLAGQIVQGLAWGAFQSLTSGYASEICPAPLRPLLTTYINLCWVIGQLLAAGVLRAAVNRTDPWAWRIPYAFQFIWPVPIFVICWLAPESPWWLTRYGRDRDAVKSLHRLLNKSNLTSEQAEELVKDYHALIQFTEAVEHLDRQESIKQKRNRYIDCFKGVDLRRTEIACWAWLIQITSGSPLQSFSTYFFSQAGLSTTNAFNMTIGMYALGGIGTVLSWFLIDRAGRRPLYIWGQIGMFATMLITGILGFAHSSTAVSWAVGAMLLVCTLIYGLTIGPVCFAIIAEVSSTRLRNKTIVLACNTYNVALIVSNLLQPKMLNSNEWNWGPKSGLFWSGTCALSIVWTYYRLPELANRTYGELDVLFGAKVPARKFASTTIDQFTTIRQEMSCTDVETSSIEKVADVKDKVTTDIAEVEVATVAQLDK